MCNECCHILNAIFARQLLQRKAESRGGGMDFVNGNMATLLTHSSRKRGHIINPTNNWHTNLAE